MAAHKVEPGVCSAQTKDIWSHNEQPGSGVAKARLRARHSITNLKCGLAQFKTYRQAVIKNRILLERILRLPYELQCVILCQITPSDVLSLRQTCRAFKDLVNDCAPSIARTHAASASAQYLRLYCSRAPDVNPLRTMMEMMHRQNVSKNLARLISDYFRRQVLGMSHRKGKRFRMFFDRMADSLQPMVLALLHFFESFRQAILERALRRCRSGHSFVISTGGPTLWEDQLAILKQYGEDELLNCYHVYGFLLHIIEHQLTPTRLDRLMGQVKRTRIMAATTGEVEILLLLGGLGQVRRVLSPPTWAKRRSALEGFIHGLKPGDESDWRKTWSLIHLNGCPVPADRVPNLRVTLPALHLVWVPSVLKLLLDNKTIDRIDYESGAPVAGREMQTPVSFICDLLRDTVLGNIVLQHDEHGEGHDDAFAPEAHVEALAHEDSLYYDVDEPLDEMDGVA